MSDEPVGGSADWTIITVGKRHRGRAPCPLHFASGYLPDVRLSTTSGSLGGYFKWSRTCQSRCIVCFRYAGPWSNLSTRIRAQL